MPTTQVFTNIHQAKTHLSRLIEKAVLGEEVIISRAGKPVVVLVPYTSVRAKRKPGILKGKIRISQDFDTLPSYVLDTFYTKI